MKNLAVETKNAHPTITASGIIEQSPTALKPWPNNPRTHSEKQLTKLRASIQQFGFTLPVIVDELNVILAGHGRTLAAISLGLTTIPTRVVTGLNDTQKRAYVITDNKISMLSNWDDVLLKSELEILIQQEFEIEVTGFSTAEIDIMFDEGGAPAENSPDDLQPEDETESNVSRGGDLWVLGDHRLLCGNALDASCYKLLMQESMAQMVITDMPYNVAIKGNVCGNGKIKHKEFAMASGEMSQSEFVDFLEKAFTQIHAFAIEGAILYGFMDWRHTMEIQSAALPLFGAVRQLCVWVKDNGGMGSFYRSQHELVFVFKKDDKPHINNFELGQHGRYRTNVWNYPGVNTFKGKGYELLALHPTVKPVSMIADAIRDCSHHKGIVLDPFAGSGTILIAAELTGRYARAMELDPHYVDVAVMRWQRITGKQAILESTGQTWEQVSVERLMANECEAQHGL